MSTYTIFIVEDDETIAALVRDALARWGFHAVCAEDFSDIIGEFRRVRPDLVLLDISLPFFNGYYWCSLIRKESNAPILFLSSHDQNADVVMAVNMGADDYIIKPFSIDVLVAKVNAMMRRAYDYFVETSVLHAGEVALNLSDASLTYQDKRVELTKNETRMLSTLLENKNAIVSRETMIRKLWDDESFIDDNTLSVNVNRLRKKLADIGLSDFIQTKKGAGYIVHV